MRRAFVFNKSTVKDFSVGEPYVKSSDLKRVYEYLSDVGTLNLSLTELADMYNKFVCEYESRHSGNKAIDNLDEFAEFLLERWIA